jgi:ketosteroid isomerase-like protein
MNTLEDELALRNLMSRYVDAVNRRDAPAWGATWAPEGSWNLMGTAVSGRDNIVGLWQQMMAGFEFAVMMPASGLFAVSGDTASGHWYLQEYTRDLEGNTGTVLSRYLDTYIRLDGEWLYQSRDYSFIYHGAADLSGNYTPLPAD